MTPNPDNVGTLETCQRLQKAGIVLKTDVRWCKNQTGTGNDWFLADQQILIVPTISIPAPCFTEVWRVLPEWAVIQKEDGTNCCWTECESNIIRNTNPTDALIDLLIWATEQRKEKS